MAITPQGPAASPLPLVSVVLPTYNRRNLVGEAIESILAQDWPRLEIVVVDDGSSDGTAEHIREKYGESVKLLVQENGGECVARNAGYALAKGDFLTALDSDDLLPPGSVRTRAETLLEHPQAGAVYGAHQRQAKDGHWTTDPLIALPETPPRSDLLVQYAKKPFFYHVDLLFRRELLPANGRLYPPGLSNHGDVLMALYVLAKAPCVACAAPAYGHRVAAGYGRMRYADEKVLAEGIEPLERFLRESEVAPALQPCAPIMRARFLMRMAKAARRLGEKRLYRSYARESRLLDKSNASGFRYWKHYLLSYLPGRGGRRKVKIQP